MKKLQTIANLIGSNIEGASKFVDVINECVRPRPTHSQIVRALRQLPYSERLPRYVIERLGKNASKFPAFDFPRNPVGESTGEGFNLQTVVTLDKGQRFDRIAQIYEDAYAQTGAVEFLVAACENWAKSNNQESLEDCARRAYNRCIDMLQQVVDIERSTAPEWEPNDRTPEEYQEYLRSVRWQPTKRFARLWSQDQCQLCGDTYMVEAHHTPGEYQRLGNESIQRITALCRRCHGAFHKRFKIVGGYAMDLEPNEAEMIDDEDAIPY